MSTTEHEHDRNRDDDPDHAARVRESARRMAGVHRAAFEKLARGAGDDGAGAAHTAGLLAVDGTDRSLWLTGPDRRAPVIADIVGRRDDREAEEGRLTEEDEANARRLCAAWNLIDRLPTAVVESAGPGAVGELIAAARDVADALRSRSALRRVHEQGVAGEHRAILRLAAVLARFDGPPEVDAAGDEPTTPNPEA